MTVLSPYRHPPVTSHPVESQYNKQEGEEVTEIKQQPYAFLLLIRLTEASHDVEVIGIDYNKELFATLKAGKTTFNEDSLDELFQT